MKLLLFVFIIVIVVSCNCYQNNFSLLKNIHKNKYMNNINNKIIINRNEDTKLFMDIPLIPTALVTIGITFAIFNLDNPVDLTDQGLAKARLQRRKEKLERGEIIQPNTNADPYRWKIFEDGDEDGDLELIANGGKKKSGGGCG